MGISRWSAWFDLNIPALADLFHMLTDLRGLVVIIHSRNDDEVVCRLERRQKPLEICATGFGDKANERLIIQPRLLQERLHARRSTSPDRGFCFRFRFRFHDPPILRSAGLRTVPFLFASS